MEQDAGGLVLPAETHPGQVEARVGVLRLIDHLADRDTVPGVGRREQVAVGHLLHRGGEGVEEPGHRGHENEGCAEDAGEEVEASETRGECRRHRRYSRLSGAESSLSPPDTIPRELSRGQNRLLE